MVDGYLISTVIRQTGQFSGFLTNWIRSGLPFHSIMSTKDAAPAFNAMNVLTGTGILETRNKQVLKCTCISYEQVYCPMTHACFIRFHICVPTFRQRRQTFTWKCNKMGAIWRAAVTLKDPPAILHLWRIHQCSVKMSSGEFLNIVNIIMLISPVSHPW